jgi:hypothetical protein
MITKYEVQHYTLCDGWINTWTYYDDNGNEVADIYDTYEEAEKALDYFLDQEKKAFKRGEIDSMYEADEFRIAEIKEVQNA